MNKAIKKVVIAGGGTAGWMSAALLKRVMQNAIDIELIESEEIGIIGVGEATIPPIQIFNQYLGINEPDFLRETKATIKLAIRFENWRKLGDQYYHTFGAPGTSVGFSPFQHYWLRGLHQGIKTSLWDYDLNYLCCDAGVFSKFDSPDPLYQVPYAYHLDSGLYGRYLRKLSEHAGVKRIEGKISHVNLNPTTGDVQSLQMQDGSEISGDLFIDCTGMRGLLIQGALHTGYEDWQHWLPCDRALAVPSERFAQTLPFTRSIARSVGWQWRIPLTHRNGNGLVFSSSHISDDQAENILLSNLESSALAEPKLIKFRTGRTTQQWNRNVVSVGLSSGFLEPLESTSIHLIQSAIVRLLKIFPQQEIKQVHIDEYNRESKIEYETVRDFIILHYHANERDDTEFWRYLQNMPIPERLSRKIKLFKETGNIFSDHLDIFHDSSWLQVMLGQGIIPLDYHPSANVPSAEQLSNMLSQIAAAKRKPLAQLLKHDEFLAQYAGGGRG